MTNTYTDTVSGLVKPYQLQVQLVLTHQDLAGPDVYDVRGTVVKGLGVGGSVSGSVWIDPVTKLTTKTPGYPGAFSTGYALDNTAVANCADGTPANTSITTLMIGGGGGSSTSLRGYQAAGLTFALG
jgi:hypothetical protein